VTSPEVVTRIEAQLPVNANAPTQDHVLLECTVGADGRPSEIIVIESAGEAWDRAASHALEHWVFRPARHEGVAVAARLRLSFSLPASLFAAPDAGLPSTDAGAGEDSSDAGLPIAEPDDAFAVSDESLEATHPKHNMATTVLGRGVQKTRGPGDFDVDVGNLSVVPRARASAIMTLAPSILLTNEGGEGHPDQIFLRGFDAHEGQDIALTVDGIPINDSGNLHGNGFADLNFLIPELVEGLRVVEGPFDPRQGNFAVAGSADFRLGLAERGLVIKGAAGSFDTSRLVLLWGPPGETSRTFGGVQLFRTQGFGKNREAQNARAMAQYEGRLSDTTSFRVGAAGYGAAYRSAGLLRADDVAAGRVGTFDTYDPRQGGDAIRAQLHADLHGHLGHLTHDQTAFFVYRSSRLLENFTGFLNDTQLAQQLPHGQRGDLIDRDTSSFTVGIRGAARHRARLFERNQELEAGYFFRFDSTRGVQNRVLDGTFVPYHRDIDLDSKLTDMGAYVDANFSPFWWLTMRGGLRGEFLTYNVNNLCAQKEVRRPSPTTPPGDASCLTQQDFGRYREADQRSTATGSALLPRGSIFLGPVAGVTLSGSVGTGIRSIDPQFIGENLKAPFASIFAWEGGATWMLRQSGSSELSARGLVFGTHVDKDLIFSEQAGRGLIGGGTTRLGALFAGRARGGFYDVSGSLTWVRSQFDDTKLLVPYVPDFVGRLDAALFHVVPWIHPLSSDIQARVGLGLTYVGRRAIPYGQRSSELFIADLAADFSWKWLMCGVALTNLFDTRAPLGEYNFASNFKSSQEPPTLVPARHFSASAPRAVLVTFGLHLGGQP
jgi:TonB family protein